LLEEFIQQNSNTSQKQNLLKTKSSSDLEKSLTTQSAPIELATKNIERVFASPLAKRIAKNENIELSLISGTGPRGRIVKADVLSSLNKKEHVIKRHSQEYSLIPNTSMRKIIAKRLTESKQTVPHFYLSIECVMDSVLEIRTQINKNFTDDNLKRLSVNDFIILASAKALKDVPETNSSWNENAIIRYHNIDVSVAVAIEGGLITPVIRNADQKDLIAISVEMKNLVKRARQNALKPEEFQGGSFSISNLGMYGIKNFNAIINPPQGCILAVGASNKRAVVIDDKIEIRTIMDATLSCDHRVVDGAVGAAFLNAFRKYIESPILMFI
jgi:pyruvate dehydrogenase E2 component (dihydrolipoamide acetyltransferase)